jgi:uncharacterized SAM-binding protein YcdF (DUF218 family)
LEMKLEVGLVAIPQGSSEANIPKADLAPSAPTIVLLTAMTDKTLSKSNHPWWRRRSVLLPTWRGWLVMLIVTLPLLIAGCRQLHPFLAITDSKPGGLLVVEGWAPDEAYRLAIQEFRTHEYTGLCVTGGPLETGAPLAEYRTYAERGAAIVLALGLSSNVVHAVPAPRVRADRTYVSAVALKRWMDLQNAPTTKINLLTVGPHARRSRLLFEEAFGKTAEIGIISVPPLDYDAARWWRSSPGVRNVIGELLAYGYVKFLFSGA